MITQEQAQEAYKKYNSKRAAAKALNMSRTTFRRKLGNVDKEDIADEYEKIEKSFSQDSGTVVTKSFTIKTLEEALEYSNVDLELWEVDRYVINSWQVTSKSFGAKTNYQVKVWLKRKVPEKIDIALSNLTEKLIANKIEFTPSKVSKSKSVLVVPGLVDHHFGLLAWGRETGNDYDLKIAEDLYVRGMEKGIDAVKDYEIAQFLLPVGSDFFHINAPDNRTPKGNNPLDVDSRLAKVFEVGFYSVIKAVERASPR
jgi:hypothetical protein